ncbi:MAG: ECF-type sigma factor [Blastocatellia bacterium]
MEPSPQEITQLLRDWRNGDASALDRLVPLVYDELRRAARAQMARQREGHTLQTTAVINEVYLRLVDSSDIEWEDRAHFVRFCAAVMRNILVDHFRRRRRQDPLDEAAALPQEQDINLLRLDDALDDLAKLDPRASQVVNLKFFGGLTMGEIAEALNVSLPTVNRDWRRAKRWLKAELEGGTHQ